MTQEISSTEPEKFRPEVLVAGETSWAANTLVFDTEQEALDWAVGLKERWLLVREVRAVPVSHPRDEPYVSGSEAII